MVITPIWPSALGRSQYRRKHFEGRRWLRIDHHVSSKIHLVGMEISICRDVVNPGGDALSAELAS